MSRWGVVALAVAAATVIGIGMAALRMSEPDTGDAGVDSAGRVAPTAGSDDTDRPAGRARPRENGRHHERRRSRGGEPSVRKQLRRLRRSLERRDEPARRTDVYVTVSLRKPLPLTIADRRRSPLPGALPDSTAYTLYAETGSGQRRVLTEDLGDDGPLDGVAPRRVVVLGMSLPLDDYRAVGRDLRALPVGAHDVTLDEGRAAYLSAQAYGDAAIRSWSRYYRRLQRTA